MVSEICEAAAFLPFPLGSVLTAMHSASLKAVLNTTIIWKEICKFSPFLPANDTLE